MRALCGAIITAGALIGLGFLGLGLGTRYANRSHWDPTANDNKGAWSEIPLHWGDLDRPLALILIVLLIAVGIGIATAFMGLAFHHERRHREHLLNLQRHQHEGGPRLQV